MIVLIPEKTVTWLVEKDLSRALANVIRKLNANAPSTRRQGYRHGSLRLIVDNDVTCIWNVEYLSGSGIENWGVFHVSDGLVSEDLETNPIERVLKVIHSRLQGQNLPRAYNFKSHQSGLCTVTAWQNSKQSLVFKDVRSHAVSQSFKVVLVSGLSGENEDWRKFATRSQFNIDKLETASMGANNYIASFEAGVYPNSEIPQLLQSLSGVDYSQVDNFDLSLIPLDQAYKTLTWTYSDWTGSGSTLTPDQRQILSQNVIMKSPVRITGAAGSGKTLLLQLTVLSIAEMYSNNHQECSILFLSHSSDMSDKIQAKIKSLDDRNFVSINSSVKIDVKTLYNYATTRIGSKPDELIDSDAFESKELQRSFLTDAIKECISDWGDKIYSFPALKKPLIDLTANLSGSGYLMDLLGAEIGVAIKAHDLRENKRKYVYTEVALSRLHAVLCEEERRFVFDVFEQYETFLDDSGLIDTDDVAISCLGHLYTPIWRKRRKSEGYDFVFVDEAQLFNENELRLIPLLTKGDSKNLKVAFALDKAQELRGNLVSGLGLLGYESIYDYSLHTIHRCSSKILELAFFLVQHSSDLFDPDFPDFTKFSRASRIDDKMLAIPEFVTSDENHNVASKVYKIEKALRSNGSRSIGIIAHSEHYFNSIKKFYKRKCRDLHVLSRRGEDITYNKPKAVLTTAEHVGGQEFDSVISVGLEEGVVPPSGGLHSGLQVSLRERAIREMYISFTRARNDLFILIDGNQTLTPLLKEAISKGLISYEAKS